MITELSKTLENCKILDEDNALELKQLFDKIFEKIFANKLEEAEDLQKEFFGLVKTRYADKYNVPLQNI